MIRAYLDGTARAVPHRVAEGAGRTGESSIRELCARNGPDVREAKHGGDRRNEERRVADGEGGDAFTAGTGRSSGRSRSGEGHHRWSSSARGDPCRRESSGGLDRSGRSTACGAIGEGPASRVQAVGPGADPDGGRRRAVGSSPAWMLCSPVRTPRAILERCTRGAVVPGLRPGAALLREPCRGDPPAEAPGRVGSTRWRHRGRAVSIGESTTLWGAPGRPGAREAGAFRFRSELRRSEQRVQELGDRRHPVKCRSDAVHRALARCLGEHPRPSRRRAVRRCRHAANRCSCFGAGA